MKALMVLATMAVAAPTLAVPPAPAAPQGLFGLHPIADIRGK